MNESKPGIYSVNAIGNFYNGSIYEQGLDSFFVLANTPEEAKEIALKFNTTVTDMFKEKRYGNAKRRAIRKSEPLNVKIGVGEPKLTSMTTFRKVLTSKGNFELVNIENEIDEMIEYLEEMSSVREGDIGQLMWEWFELNMSNSGIYPGDAVPEDYLNKMSYEEVQTLYNYIKTTYKTHLEKELRKAI